MHVCMYVCVHVCTCACVCACMCVRVRVRVRVRVKLLAKDNKVLPQSQHNIGTRHNLSIDPNSSLSDLPDSRNPLNLLNFHFNLFKIILKINMLKSYLQQIKMNLMYDAFYHHCGLS